jgi:ribosomal-protein-alanine N-acetyltransferase
MLTHKGTVTLHTSRLILRQFTVDDAQAVYDGYTSDEHVAKQHNLNVHNSVKDTKAMIIEWIAKYDNPEYYHWVIECRGIIVGEINLFDVDNRSERCELGYTIGSKWWNNGIATEATAEVIRYAFAEVNFNKICARYDTENIGSGKVMQKNGMKQERLSRHHNTRKNGTKTDTAFYTILKSEWAIEHTI